MDDLLSTALTESGLGDYFTVNGVTKESPAEQQEQRLISQGGSETSECSSPTGQEVAQRTSIETHSSNEGFFGSSSTSNQEITEGPAPIERRPIAVARPGTNGVRVVLRRGADGIDPARALNSQLIRRTIQTSSGTRTQILKPVRNENGEVEYREIKFQQGNIRRGGGPGGATTRIIPGTSAPTAQKRMVIVKQQTPNGPRYVKQILPAGAEVRTEIDQRGQVVRRIVTRGQPLQAGQIGLQRPAITLQRANPDIALHQQPGGQAIRKVASGPVFNTVARNSRPLQAFERANYRPSTPNQQSRPTSRNDYSPIHSPGGRALPNVNSSPSFNKIKMQSRTGVQPTSANDIRKRLPPIAQPQQQPRSSVDLDEKKLQQQKEDKQFVTAKSQKAKEEMKQAMISGRHRIDDEEDDNLGYAETYSDYRPAKLRSGLAHPDSVVETASLSSVAPPDVTYTCTMPEYLIDTGSISALQLEAVIYACQAHERRLPSGERCGYLIGDGAGVGKGRTVAGIIFENYLLGRKRSIWLSVSSDLRFDSERDLRDIGASRIKVHPLNKLKYAKINGSENGNIKKGCIFATYSSLIGECRTASKKYRSRLNQLVQWFGVDYDGAIIFDECHRAKNLVPGAGGKSTKTGKVVLELQKCLPNARIVYASATGATEPRNMAYMTRLGLWGTGQAFHEFQDFINAVERRGVGAMEVVAMDMKQRGLYLARQLSFRGVSFRVEEVTLSDEFIKVYDESVKLWMECRRQFQVVLSTMSDSERSTNKHIWGQFWAAHQRFFKYLCIGAKVEACVRMCREAIKSNKCVVIGLQSTGESRTNEVLEEAGGELSEFVSTAKAVLSGLIEKNFPTERGNCVDVFRDFDRMYDEFDSRPKKRKAPGNPFGLDVLAELGLTLPKSQKSKRGRIENGESTSNNDSDDDEDEDDENTSNMSDEDTDSGPEMKIGDNDADWVNALLAEAASSSDTDNNEEEEESHKSAASDTDDKQKLITSANTESSGEEDVDEFNPFFYDFSRGDPYLKNSSAVRKKEKTEEEIEEERRKKRIRKKQKKRKLVKEHQKLERKKQKRELQTQAMQSTANEFISSSRIIDGYHVNPQIIKAELLAAVERLGPQLPTNTLDQLIDELGGPEYVAEMTGRKGRIVTRPDGEIEYELRSAAADVPLELMNMDEKDKFMKGEKLVAVISEAASSGISLQSDKRAENQRRRVHITLELPWSADKAIQQFGRTHRSNQVSAPEYVFLISELAGEKRFASIVAKRLESLGALTHGDRRATETRDLSQFNLDNKYGRAALDVMLKSVIGALSPPLIEPPKNYKPGDFFADMRLYLDGVGVLSKLDNGQYAIEREGAMISKFLNRILGLPVHAQNALFQYFTEIVSELVKQAKHDGTYDMGIMDLGTGGDQVQKQETRIFLGKAEKGSFRVDINKIGVERGIPWEDAHAIYLQHNTGEDGFYVSTPQHSIRKVITLVYGIGKRRLDTGDRLYALTRPATGRSAKMETYNDLIRRFGKVSPEEAEIIWKNQYESSQNMCQHKYVYGRCRNEENHKYCETGRSTRTYFVLSGSVLSVWPVVESVLNDSDSRSSSKIQVIRVRTDTDQKIVGLLVLPHFVRQLVLKLEEHCGRSFIEAKKEKVIPPPPLMTREEILNQLD